LNEIDNDLNKVETSLQKSNVSHILDSNFSYRVLASSVPLL